MARIPVVLVDRHRLGELVGRTGSMLDDHVAYTRSVIAGSHDQAEPPRHGPGASEEKRGRVDVSEVVKPSVRQWLVRLVPGLLGQPRGRQRAGTHPRQ
jgi:hypothetical protein